MHSRWITCYFLDQGDEKMFHPAYLRTTPKNVNESFLPFAAKTVRASRPFLRFSLPFFPHQDVLHTQTTTETLHSCNPNSSTLPPSVPPSLHSIRKRLQSSASQSLTRMLLLLLPPSLSPSPSDIWCYSFPPSLPLAHTTKSCVLAALSSPATAGLVAHCFITQPKLFT